MSYSSDKHSPSHSVRSLDCRCPIEPSTTFGHLRRHTTKKMPVAICHAPYRKIVNSTISAIGFVSPAATGKSATLSSRPKLIFLTTTSISKAVLSSCLSPKTFVIHTPARVRLQMKPTKTARSSTSAWVISSLPAPKEPRAITAIPSKEPLTQKFENLTA